MLGEMLNISLLSLIWLNLTVHIIKDRNHYFTQLRNLKELGSLDGTVTVKTSLTSKMQWRKKAAEIITPFNLRFNSNTMTMKSMWLTATPIHTPINAIF